MHRRGADLSNPDSVKKIIAEQESWSKGRKWNVVKAYTLFLKMQGLTWEKPRYKPVEKIFDLKWTDIDTVTKTIRVTPEKRSNPRVSCARKSWL